MTDYNLKITDYNLNTASKGRADFSSLVSELFIRAELQPNAAAMIDGDYVLTYGQFRLAVERLARGLFARGVRPGDRIALHLRNIPELAITYYACMHTGIIAAPLNTRYKAPEMERLLRRLQPALYIGQADLYNSIAALDHSILAADRRFLVDEPMEEASTQGWDTLLDDVGTSPVGTFQDADAPTMLLPTSGSTGEPKFVVHTARTLLAMVSLFKEVHFVRDDVALAVTPIVHMSGVMTLMATLGAGATLVLMHQFEPALALDLIERRRCTLLKGLPITYAGLIEQQRVRERTVNSLRCCLVGGDVPPPGLQDEFLSLFGVRLRNVMAMTEAVGTFTYGFPNGPVCRVVDRDWVRLVSQDGATARRGETGEIALRGPNVFAGYWLGVDQLDTGRKQGWFYTGDLAVEDEEGSFWFVGRSKNFIVRGDSKISPIEVEQALLNHPAVRDAVVVGVPDPVLGEKVLGVVQLADHPTDALLDEILHCVSRQVSDYKVPERLIVVPQIPRNSLGKVDRKVALQTIDATL